MTVNEIKKWLEPGTNEFNVYYKDKEYFLTNAFNYEFSIFENPNGGERGANTLDEFLALPIPEWGGKSLTDVIADIELG